MDAGGEAERLPQCYKGMPQDKSGLQGVGR
jgi:hypothetical protein